jgi:ubiquinol-cytochrome c reductase cytochrome b subunit
VLWTRSTGGVELLAPANASEAYSAARPEWFMLWLFQFLKFFPGGTEVWGAMVIPGLVFVVLAAMPLVGRWRGGAVFNASFVLALATGALLLIAQAWRQDQRDPTYALALKQAHLEAERVRYLAGGPYGIPVAGASELLRSDPLTQGPRLFARHCASCHRYDGHDGLGGQLADPASGADLRGFASRDWLAGLLDPGRIATAQYFGGTKFAQGKMVKFVRGEVAEFTPENRAKLTKVVTALSAEAQLPAQRKVDARDAALIAEGRDWARSEAMQCTECHQFRQPDDTATAPDLTGYGSRSWLVEFITDAAHPRFYGKRNDRMPRFGKEAILTASEIGLLADWLRGDWPASTPK